MTLKKNVPGAQMISNPVHIEPKPPVKAEPKPPVKGMQWKVIPHPNLGELVLHGLLNSVTGVFHSDPIFVFDTKKGAAQAKVITFADGHKEFYRLDNVKLEHVTHFIVLTKP